MVRYFGSDLRKMRNTIYLGNADAYVSNSLKLTTDELYRDIKLGTLFYNHVIFSAAFFWQNNKINKLIYNLEEFVHYGLVLPSIRNPQNTNDILDYVEARQEETSKENKDQLDYFGLGDEIVKQSDIIVAKSINKYTSILHQEGMSVRDNFKYLFRNDLKNETDIKSIYSILARSAFSNQYIQHIEAFKKLAFHKDFSRSFVLSEIMKYGINKLILQKIGERLSYLFLKANSNIYNSDLMISSSKKELFLNPYNDIFKGNLYLVKEIFNSLGITTLSIDFLNARDIIIIRQSSEFKKFYNTYVNILSLIKEHEISSIDNVLGHIIRKKNFDSSKKLLTIPAIFFKNVSKEILTFLLFKYYGIESSIISNSIVSSSYDLIERLVPKIKLFDKSGIDEFAKYFIEREFEKESIKLLKHFN